MHDYPLLVLSILFLGCFAMDSTQLAIVQPVMMTSEEFRKLLNDPHRAELLQEKLRAGLDPNFVFPDTRMTPVETLGMQSFMYFPLLKILKAHGARFEGLLAKVLIGAYYNLEVIKYLLSLGANPLAPITSEGVLFENFREETLQGKVVTPMDAFAQFENRMKDIPAPPWYVGPSYPSGQDQIQQVKALLQPYLIVYSQNEQRTNYLSVLPSDLLRGLLVRYL